MTFVAHSEQQLGVNGAHTATGKPLLAKRYASGTDDSTVWYGSDMTAPWMECKRIHVSGRAAGDHRHNDRIGVGASRTTARTCWICNSETFNPAIRMSIA